jgi:hypothetical protein
MQAMKILSQILRLVNWCIRSTPMPAITVITAFTTAATELSFKVRDTNILTLIFVMPAETVPAPGILFIEL